MKESSSSLPLQNESSSQPEFELLCALTNAQPSPQQIERIASWDRSSLDWTELLRLADRHGVLPLVARNLTAHAPDLPTSVERDLRSAYEANLRRNFWFTAELARIQRHFDTAALTAVPFKGPALTQTLYRDLGLRTYNDLDFLISPPTFGRAKELLHELAYQPSSEISPALERLWLRTGYERSFDAASGKNLLELQWAILPRCYAVDLPVDDLLARAEKCSVGERSIPCLSPEDSLLLLCLHAAKHLWTRLIWLSDIVETLRTQKIDYALAFARAETLGIQRILGVSFYLAKNILRAEIPGPVEELIVDDPSVATLGAEFASRLACSADYNFESLEYFRLIANLRERRRDRSRFFIRLLLTPSAGDVDSIPLPEPLFPLYRLVRIARLVKKFIKIKFAS